MHAIHNDTESGGLGLGSPSDELPGVVSGLQLQCPPRDPGQIHSPPSRRVQSLMQPLWGKSIEQRAYDDAV